MSNEELVQLYQNGDKKALDKLIQANTGIIHKIANKYNGINRELEFDDLFQSGVLGLINAVEKYNCNHEKKAKFITYAVFLIDRYIYWCVNGRGSKEIENKNCFSCGEDTISYNFVRDFIMSIEDKYGVNIVSIGYDLRDMNSTREDLKEHYDLVEVRQHSSVLHSPIKWLKEYILNKKFVYNENKLLEINFTNCVQTEDTNLNKYLNKKKSNGKIDMVMSMVNALYLLQQVVVIGEEESWAVQTC